MAAENDESLRLTVTTRSAQHLAVSFALSRVLLERVDARAAPLALALAAAFSYFERCVCAHFGLLSAAASPPAQLLGLALQLAGCVCLWAGGEWSVQLANKHLPPLILEPSGEVSPETILGLCAGVVTAICVSFPVGDLWRRLREWRPLRWPPGLAPAPAAPAARGAASRPRWANWRRGGAGAGRTGAGAPAGAPAAALATPGIRRRPSCEAGLGGSPGDGCGGGGLGGGLGFSPSPPQQHLGSFPPTTRHGMSPTSELAAHAEPPPAPRVGKSPGRRCDAAAPSASPGGPDGPGRSSAPVEHRRGRVQAATRPWSPQLASGRPKGCFRLGMG